MEPSQTGSETARPFYEKKRKLEAHPNGYFYLRINGRRYNCGRDKKTADQDARRILSEIRMVSATPPAVVPPTPTRQQAVGQAPAPQPLNPFNPDMSVGELSAKYIEWLLANRARETYLMKKRIIDHFENFVGRNRMLSSLRRFEMENFVKHMNKNHRKNISGEEHAIRETKTMMRWGEDQGYCQIPLRLFPKRQQRIASAGTKCFMPEELALLLARVPPDFADVIRFGMLTGLRPKELRELHFSQIQQDFNGRPFIRIEHHKTSEMSRVPISRTLPLPAACLEIIERQRQKHPQLKFVFVNGDGTPYDRDSFRRRLTRWCDRLKIRKLPAYALRHFFGTMQGVAQINLDTLSKLMGHSNVLMTTRYMANVMDFQREPMEKYAQKISEIIAAAKPR